MELVSFTSSKLTVRQNVVHGARGVVQRMIRQNLKLSVDNLQKKSQKERERLPII